MASSVPPIHVLGTCARTIRCRTTPRVPIILCTVLPLPAWPTSVQLVTVLVPTSPTVELAPTLRLRSLLVPPLIAARRFVLPEYACLVPSLEPVLLVQPSTPNAKGSYVTRLPWPATSAPSMREAVALLVTLSRIQLSSTSHLATSTSAAVVLVSIPSSQGLVPRSVPLFVTREPARPLSRAAPTLVLVSALLL
jgi:hypothetical protein